MLPPLPTASQVDVNCGLVTFAGIRGDLNWRAERDACGWCCRGKTKNAHNEKQNQYCSCKCVPFKGVHGEFLSDCDSWAQNCPMDSGESGGPLMLVNSERKLVTSITPNQGKAALIVSKQKNGIL